MKKRIVSIVCLLAMLLSMTTMGAFSASAATVGSVEFIDVAPVENLDYSFAILGDIQTINTYEVKHQNTYKSLTNMFTWLVKNQESRKIEYVLGLGDTVDTLYTYPESYNPIYYNRVEWEKARTCFKKLNGVIPYMVVRGNHDDEIGYNKYIATTEYQNQIIKDANGNEVGGFYYDPNKTATKGNSMSNCYRKLEIGNHKYLMLGLDYAIGAANDGNDVVEWANGVIAANPDYKVIISLHTYLSTSGEYMQGLQVESSNGDRTATEPISFYGRKLWNMFKTHSNIFMIFSGHVSVDDPVVSYHTGEQGNQIINILVDPQSTYEFDPADPNGKATLPLPLVLMMNVTNGGKALEFEYICTDKNKQLKAKNRFTIELPEGTLPEYIAAGAEVVTEAPTTEAATTTEAPVTTEAPKKNNCKNSITSTVAVCCTMGTALAAFAMRKRKED